jgi:hypothetical protein
VAAPDPELAGVSVVFVGAMNPTILQPAWLSAHGLIREEEAESAEIRIIHPDIVAYSLEWADIEVTRERCQFKTTTTSEAAEPVRDLALGVFTILKHTPIRLIGLNSEAHHKVASEDRWHEIGHTLAPDAQWKGLLDRPGVRSLLMEGARTDDRVGWIRVTVEPSLRVQPGIYIAINDHYDLSNEKASVTTTEPALSIVGENWEHSLQLGERAAELVLAI